MENLILAKSISIIVYLILGLLILGVYFFISLVYMKIAKRLKLKNPKIAWIPSIGPLIITYQISKMHWWPFIFFGLSFVMSLFNLYFSNKFIFILYLLFSLVYFVMFFIWTWKLFERLKRPGWWALLLLIPIVNFIIFGIILWPECDRFIKLYFKSIKSSIKSINLKHIYSALADASLILLFIIFSFIFALISELIFNISGLSSLTNFDQIGSLNALLFSFVLIYLLFLFFSTFVFSISRFSLYSLLIKKWLGWKKFFYYYLFNLVYFIVFVLILTLLSVLFSSILLPHVFHITLGITSIIIIFIFSYYLLKFNIIYFNKFKVFDSLKELFGLGYGFLGRFLIGILILFIVSFIITLFIRFLHLLNFSNNFNTSQFIYGINFFLISVYFLIFMAWFRDYLLQYYKKLN